MSVLEKIKSFVKDVVVCPLLFYECRQFIEQVPVYQLFLDLQLRDTQTEVSGLKI